MDEPRAEGRARTFVIVDLAGFSAATEVHGDETAADLAVQLTDLASSTLGSDDLLVKSLGDAVLAACADPPAAVAFLRAAFEQAASQSGLPLLRAGAHHGPAAERDGDFFGSAVNIAARVADLASGGHVHATLEVADAARNAGIEVVDLGDYELRNIGRSVEIFDLLIDAASVGAAIDPVCRMRVDRARAAGRLRHRGHEYWLCSLECAAAFTADPGRYAEG
jgi:class 3 adenylate cyclase